MSQKTENSEETPVVRSVDRIVLAVRDLASAESIYTRMLGRTPSGRREDRSGGTERLLYRLSNMTLELVSVFGSGSWSSIVASRLDMGGEGLLALFLRTDGVVAAAETLKARGLPAVVLAENEGHDKGGRVRRWRNALIPPEASRELMIVINEVLGDPDDLKPAPLREGVTEAEAISELDHVVVMTRDAEACKRFFGDQLGIRLALDHSKPEWGVRQLFFRLGGVTIEVVQSLDETKVPEKDFLWGLAWKASNVATVAARLAREGADVSEVRIGRKKGTEVATIRKPTCGVPTLLVGPIAAES